MLLFFYCYSDYSQFVLILTFLHAQCLELPIYNYAKYRDVEGTQALKNAFLLLLLCVLLWTASVRLFVCNPHQFKQLSTVGLQPLHQFRRVDSTVRSQPLD